MLIEDYMIGLPWTEWKIREQFRKVLGPKLMRPSSMHTDQACIAEADIAFLAQQGFNFVRLPSITGALRATWPPASGSKGVPPAGSRRCLCRKYNIWVLLDLHAAPGAQARDQNAGSAYGEIYLWDHREFLDRPRRCGAEIARRYSGDRTIAGYNLLCEPVTTNVALLNEFYLKTIRAIRKVDPDHIIVLDRISGRKESPACTTSCSPIRK